MDKSPDAFRTISEVAEALETPAHVLRFWESRFPQIRPVKRAGGRRYYRPADVALLTGIKRLLHDEGMTIRGVQKVLREQGIRHVSGLHDDGSPEEEALDAAMSGRFDDEPGLPLDLVEDKTAAALTAALDADTPRVIPFAPPQPQSPAPAPQGEAQAPAEALDQAQDTGEEFAQEFASGDAPDTMLPAGPQGALEWLNSLPAVAADTGAVAAKTADPADAPEPAAPSDTSEPTAAPATPVATGPSPDQATTQPASPAPSVQQDDATATLAARLRALPLGALADRQEALAALSARITDLRGRLSGLPSRR